MNGRVHTVIVSTHAGRARKVAPSPPLRCARHGAVDVTPDTGIPTRTPHERLHDVRGAGMRAVQACVRHQTLTCPVLIRQSTNARTRIRRSCARVRARACVCACACARVQVWQVSGNKTNWSDPSTNRTHDRSARRACVRACVRTKRCAVPRQVMRASG
jgi:hypothetical protein